jgi:phosphatidylinositol alpha-mannosyltransferase
MGWKGSVVQIPLSGIRRWLCNRAAVNILPTQWLGTILKLKRMQTVHHGIPAVSEFTQIASGSIPCFGFQGRLVTTKGIRVLLDAAEQLRKENRDFRVKIIGGGPELEGLKASVTQSGTNVEFLGYVPDERLHEAMRDVSVVVMPSLAGEVFGLVAAENMLQGKLVIVSDLGSLKEVVGDAGLTFRNGDAADLAARMREVLDDSSLAAAIGAKARERARSSFDQETMIEQHLQIYRTVLAQ